MEKNNNKLRLTLTFSLVVFITMFLVTGTAAFIGFILYSFNLIHFVDIKSPFHTIIFMAVCSIILGALLAVFVGNISAEPIRKIIESMNKLASGDFSVRLKSEGILSKHPAINSVEQSFNKMAEELENTELLRSDFINNFSHEFKTPIVSLAGFAKLLKNSELSEKERNEYIDIIEAEALRLASMATNVLEYTKYENQNILTDVTVYNLSEQIRMALIELETKWAKKDIELNISFDEFMIAANKDMLMHVWLNLFDNAVKYSPYKGTVSVNIKDVDSKLFISIANEGKEITKEQQKKIFNKFYQADESHSKDGNGIGLSLVKKVIELHKGEIVVESENGVNTFTVILPVI